MSHLFPELHQRRTGKKADPLHWFTIHQFLSQHHAHLFNKLEEYLHSESQQYEAEVSKRSVTTAADNLTSWAFATLYPNTVRYSIFIVLYGQFEYTMNEACLELEEDHPNAVRLSDLNHRGITRSYKYLEKVVGIAQPFEPDSWKKLKDLNRLRNVIVHNDAKVEKHESEIVKAIERINKWAPVRIEEKKVLLSQRFIECASHFIYEQVQHIGKTLQSAGWD